MEFESKSKTGIYRGKRAKYNFARSKAGSDLLTEARDSGYIYMEDYTKMDDLKYIQPNHFNMQTTMIGKIIGLKLCTVGGRQFSS